MGSCGTSEIDTLRYNSVIHFAMHRGLLSCRRYNELSLSTHRLADPLKKDRQAPSKSKKHPAKQMADQSPKKKKKQS